MDSYIRMKHPLAVTKPIFFPAVVLWLPQAYSDGFLTWCIQTRFRHFGADTPSNISLEFIPKSLSVFVDKLMLGMHTLGMICRGYRRVSKVTIKKWAFMGMRAGGPGRVVAVQTHWNRNIMSNHWSRKSLWKLLIWKPLSNVSMTSCLLHLHCSFAAGCQKEFTRS